MCGKPSLSAAQPPYYGVVRSANLAEDMLAFFVLPQLSQYCLDANLSILSPSHLNLTASVAPRWTPAPMQQGSPHYNWMSVGSAAGKHNPCLWQPHPSRWLLVVRTACDSAAAWAMETAALDLEDFHMPLVRCSFSLVRMPAALSSVPYLSTLA